MLPLRAQTVAEFTAELMGTLDALGLAVEIHGAPNEMVEATPFAEDDPHGSYHRPAVEAFAASLRHAHRVLAVFRARFSARSAPSTSSGAASTSP